MSNASTRHNREISVLSMEETAEKLKAPSWSELPEKSQLALLTFVRLAEPIIQTSMHAYMFTMIQWFDATLSDGVVASKAGLLAASFEASQAVTGIIWGRLADKPWMGRKKVLLVGISGSFASVVGFGFSRTFSWALFFRIVGGAMNGNVGVMRTMISEIVDDKRYQPKSFLLMPVTFNIGIIIGPLLGGLLSDPVHQYPSLFGQAWWLTRFPYALPNVVMASFTFITAVMAFFVLLETHSERRNRLDVGNRAWAGLGRMFLSLGGRSCDYMPLRKEYCFNTTTSHDHDHGVKSRAPETLPYRRIFTRNVVLTILTHCLLATHVGSFLTLWFLFLSAPRVQVDSAVFAGGLGLSSSSTGLGISIIGYFGLTLQFGVFSSITHRLGVLPTLRAAGLIFPVVYIIAPSLVLLPMRSAPPHPADGAWIWIGMTGLLFLQVIGRTFALPLIQVLTNNCSPHPSVLGSLHGIA
ncbi:MAG: hypothetical protein LQ338_001237 [Usnochroma carphineum]|nr:MAG: hypothetical protein LQ338_001237 [Usnochroma carphineum]